jgi:adenylyltransferase/sulfurtransferase
MYLAAAGVGHLTLADFDRVDLSNLQRQLGHGQADIGRGKAESMADTLHGLNPDIHMETIPQRLEGEALHRAVQAADVVIDASDNFATRFAINQACVTTRTPLVSGAAIRLEGQVTVFRNDAQSACYRCLYEEGPEPAQTCGENGVLSPLVGIIGSVQATEAIKLLAGFGQPLNGRLLTLDAATMEWREIRYSRDPQCPVCATGHEAVTA